MFYIPYAAAAALGIAALWLLGPVAGGGLLLAVAAGAAQDIPEDWGFTPVDLIYGLIRCIPPAVTANAVVRILGNVTLNSLAGGLAVPVYAGMHAVAALSAGANRIAGPEKEEN